jgi:hypothetical protein
MDISDMRAIVRRDLHDEDENDRRWTDDEIDRHIGHALSEFSERLPLEEKALLATTAGSREIDISGIGGRVTVAAVEYPVGRYPALYQRFSLWGDTLTLLGGEVPDSSDVWVYYGKAHTIDGSGSTIPAIYEDLLASGAAGHAAVEWAVYAANRVNAGGASAPGDLLEWGNRKLKYFSGELKRLGRRNRVRVGSMYRPYCPPVSRSADFGPLPG